MKLGLTPYEELALEKINGCPLCPECGLQMQIDRGRWSCLNERCSIISVDMKKGSTKILTRVVRDSILYSEILRGKEASQISGNVYVGGVG